MRAEHPHSTMSDCHTFPVDPQPKRPFCLRFVLALGLLVWIICSPARSAQAQGAYVGATIPVGNVGGSLAVAVDAGGDVFAGEGSTLYEIVAVNGTVNANSQANTIASGFKNLDGMAIDAKGNIFIADPDQAKVFEIVANNGSVSSTSPVNVIGSGFNTPIRVAVDTKGDVFVVDEGTNKVLEIVAVNGEVSATSQVTPIGSGFSGPIGIAVDAKGNVFVADIDLGKVFEIVAVNGAVSATSQVNPIASGFSYPSGVAVDAIGDIFVADNQQDAVFEIVAVNGTVSATSQVNCIASGFSYPFAVAVDANRDVFLADGSGGVKEILSSAVRPFPNTAVGSTSTATEIYFTFETAGTLASTPYVTLTQGAKNLDFKAAATQDTDACVTGHDYAVNDVCTVSVTFSPTVPGQRLGAVQLMGSEGAPIATAYISGTGTGPMVTFPPGVMSTVAGNGTLGNSGDGGAATSAEIGYPDGVTVDGASNLYIADSGSSVIRKVDHLGTITTIAGGGSGGDGGPATSARLISPESLAVDGAGNLFIADTVNYRIRMVDATGTITTVAGNGHAGFSGDGGLATNAQLALPGGVAVDGAGNLYIGDTNNHRVRKVDLSGTITTLAGNDSAGGSGDGGPATSAELYYPQSVAVDGKGNIYIGDTGTYRVRKIDPSGIITTVAGNGTSGFSGDGGPAVSASLGSPDGVAVDGVGNIFIADYVDNRIRKVDLSGTITTVAGDTNQGSGGDGGPATSAELHNPYNVAVDGAGNLYIADYNNNRIRKVDLADPPSLTFASTAVGATSSDSPQTVLVANSGNAPLSFPAPTSGQNPNIGADFTIENSATCPLVSSSGNAGTLASGTTCTIPVGFTPQKAGSITEQLVLTDNHLNQVNATQTVSLNGTATGESGTAVPVLTPASLSFGTVTLNTTSLAETATLSNTGTATLQITSFGFFGSNTSSFSETNNCGSSLAAGTSCTITILCTPTVVGSLSASLGVNFPSPLAQQSVSLSCTGAAASAPQAALTPATANFGSVNVGGTSAVQTFTLSNAGNAALAITSIHVTGANASDFATGSNTCGTSLAAGSTCTISIIFKPAIAGSESASLTVVDSVGTQSVALTGTGVVVVPPDFTLTGTPASETGMRGTSVRFTLQLGSADPNNPFTQLVNLSATGLPAGATATFSPNSVVPGAANAATSTMAVTIPTLTAQLDRGSHDRMMLAGISVASLVFCFGIAGSRRRRSLRLLTLAIFAFGAVATSLTGCGSGTGFTPPGSTSTITVTGTSGNISHSVTLTLIVK